MGIKEINLEKRFEKVTGIKFETFYRKNYDTLKWQLNKFTKDLSTAEDFTNNAFMRALNKIDTYKPEKNTQVHTWLHTIGLNLVRQEYRKNQKNQMISIDKNYSSSNDEEVTISSFLTEKESGVELQEQELVIKKAQIIKEVIENELTPKYKRVMELRMLKNLPYLEVKEQLDKEQGKQIPISTVKSQIKKGKELIKEKLNKRFSILDKNGVNRYSHF